MPFIFSDDQLRDMYRGGRANDTARRFARFWARGFRWGLFPKRWVTLEVAGRRTGRPCRYPLGMADVGGEWYLVSMLGEGSGWVLNVRAAHGDARIWRRRSRTCRLVEVPPTERGPILRRYLEKVPGGRPHIPVDRDAPQHDIDVAALTIPIFRVQWT